MRYGGLGQNGAATEQEARPAAALASIKEIPYDYVANFLLSGVFGHRVQDVITVSAEGSFVAVSIGYSFLRRNFPAPTVAGPGSTTSKGVTINGVFFQTLGLPLELIHACTNPNASTVPPSPELLLSVVQAGIARLGIDFRYSIVDSGSGRELQNLSIHNIAGLGIASGERPFRPFAQPALFLPRSTIRIEVEEISQGPLYAGGTIQIVLHGYKRLSG